ncbi:MAG: hypothetical protein KGQ40_05985, partial [Rhodospirillales bacterium]|nr:hypothetical protein [Rhodospirillales bacterium]
PIAATAPAQSELAPAPAGSAPAGVSYLPNPSLRLDPSLGIVVIEFHDGAGVVRASIPSPQQLAAYTRHDVETGAPSAPAPLPASARPSPPPSSPPSSPSSSAPHQPG